MAEGPITCANCGNVQAAGEFCEKCGMRLPAAAAAAPGAGAGGFPPPPAAGRSASSMGPGGAPPGYGPPPVFQGGGYDYSSGKGFFARLFDFSFREFITPSIIKVLFIISIVVICLGVISGIIFGFWFSVGAGFLALIGGIVYGFLMLLYVRVMLEIFILFFRIHDDTRSIARSKR